MSRMVAIWKKDLRSYCSSAIPYLFIVVFLFLTPTMFFVWPGRGPDGEFLGNFYMRGEASLTQFFAAFPIGLAILVPALCMRIWPEEYKSGTIETLLTMPLRTWEVVIGKFMAMMSIVVAAFAFTLAVPWGVSRFAQEGLDLGPIVGGYVAALLLAAAYCAIGLFTSSFVREQIVAYLLAAVICLALAFVGSYHLNLVTPRALVPIADFLSFSVRFESIARGVLDVRDMVYFASVTGVFLFLGVVAVDARRTR